MLGRAAPASIALHPALSVINCGGTGAGDGPETLKVAKQRPLSTLRQRHQDRKHQGDNEGRSRPPGCQAALTYPAISLATGSPVLHAHGGGRTPVTWMLSMNQ